MDGSRIERDAPEADLLGEPSRLTKANPSRGGDAKQEGSHGWEAARLPAHDDKELVVSHKRNLRITLALAVAAVAAVPGSTAQAADVCNQARNGHTGSYVATDGDPSIPARHQSKLAVLGNGKGLTNAATHSPALSACVVPTPPSTDGGDGGGDGGVGGIS
jgi:hypothetical protein